MTSRLTVPLTFTRYGNPTVDGALPPLVILHGLFGQKTNWNSLAKAMQQRLSSVIYTVDLRNHGTSPRMAGMSYPEQAADVIEFIKKQQKEDGFDKVNLLGHSMGGKVAMSVAVDATGGTLLNKLIVEDSSPVAYSGTAVNPVLRYIVAMRGMDMRMTRREMDNVLNTVVPEVGVRQYLLTNLHLKADGTFEWRCNLDALEVYATRVFGRPIPEGVFKGPTLFQLGERSSFVKEDNLSTIKAIFPQTKSEVIPDTGHWIHSDQPERFMDSVVRFLQE